MDRRTVLAAVAAVATALPRIVIAQPRRVPIIGFVRTDRPPQSYIDAFENGLRERGYVPGRTLTIEYRFADGTTAHTLRLARELVELNVDVIVAGGGRATQAAQSLTKTIPIVMTSASDPVGTGLVSSLAHPGANTTGTSIVSWELFGKRLELLREVLPKVSRVTVLINRLNPAPANGWKDALAIAAALGIALQRIDVQGPGEFEDAFASMARENTEALIVVQSTIFETEPFPIQNLTLRYRIPSMYGLRTSTDAGGLMSYGPNVPALYAYSAVLVDKILRGAKPADLPVEQPTKFELVINLTTAKALRLTIPEQFLLRADEIID
jgi:putative tryptophan/tyrosine transport system substrate-binding protein